MENTIENKAKFFAQYLHQRVLCNSVIETDKSIEILRPSELPCIDIGQNWHLELTPLSMISDEDAIEVAKTVYLTDSDLWTSERGRDYLDFDPNVWSMVANISDLLRSKGYALPYMGLSIAELENYGWIKLKK